MALLCTQEELDEMCRNGTELVHEAIRWVLENHGPEEMAKCFEPDLWLAVWHFVMPIGDVGHPWPAINCFGVPGRCWFTIYKDPQDTPASDYERAGLEKPARA